MRDRGMNKIVMVKRRTRLEELKRRYNTIEQARFYVEHLGADFSDFEEEHRRYYESLETARAIAGRMARVQEIDRDYVPNMIFGPEDIVVAVGQDGLVANVMKYLDGQPLLGVNPDTGRWDGHLLPFEAGDLEKILPQVIEKNYSVKRVTMGKAETGDGQVLYAVNDFFIGIRNHTSARYQICYNGVLERHSSSGVIVSTGLGMTGWHASVMEEFRGMARAFHLDIAGIPVRDTGSGWDSGKLVFQVREPYPSRYTQTGLVYGQVTATDSLTFVSDMAENGVIFSDGILEDAIDFNAGIKAVVSVAGRQGHLVTGNAA